MAQITFDSSSYKQVFACTVADKLKSASVSWKSRKRRRTWLAMQTKTWTMRRVRSCFQVSYRFIVASSHLSIAASVSRKLGSFSSKSSLKPAKVPLGVVSVFLI